MEPAMVRWPRDRRPASPPGVRFGVDELVAAKADTTVSVCLPARNEEATVGQVVATIRAALVDGVGLVDEIVVVDDHSNDRTAALATAAGARVVDASAVLRPRARPRQGRGAVEVGARVHRRPAWPGATPTSSTSTPPS